MKIACLEKIENRKEWQRNAIQSVFVYSLIDKYVLMVLNSPRPIYLSVYMNRL